MLICLWSTYDEQYDVEDCENEGDLEDYFPEDELDDSNTSNHELGSENDNDEELERVRNEKSRKEELNMDLVLSNAQTEGPVQGEGTSNATRVVREENYQDSDNAKSLSSESRSEGDGGKGEKNIKPKRISKIPR